MKYEKEWDEYPELEEETDDPHRPISDRESTEGRIEKLVKEVGPEAVEKLNDRMLQEGMITQRTHKAFSGAVQSRRK